jgi:hypothetical protein
LFCNSIKKRGGLIVWENSVRPAAGKVLKQNMAQMVFIRAMVSFTFY